MRRQPRLLPVVLALSALQGAVLAQAVAQDDAFSADRRAMVDHIESQGVADSATLAFDMVRQGEKDVQYRRGEGDEVVR